MRSLWFVMASRLVAPVICTVCKLSDRNQEARNSVSVASDRFGSVRFAVRIRKDGCASRNLIGTSGLDMWRSFVFR